MYDLYLLTGATGDLGGALIRELLARRARVRALVLRGDELEADLPQAVDICYGNVEDKASMARFFAGDLRHACLIHCAGLITIATRPDPKMWRVNVEGTRNVVELCLEHGVARAVYVSSVHAIPEQPQGHIIRETTRFYADAVRGHYAKSKAAATALSLAACAEGLSLSVVHPSGILSPYDRGRSHISAAILSYCRGRLPVAVQGGYDFVDVRDVASGILACAEQGRSGECYILSGHYATLKDILEQVRQLVGGRPVAYLPLPLIKALAPWFEWSSLVRGRPLFLTPCSAYTLGSNAAFSYGKAQRELTYTPRSLAWTVNDMIENYRRQGLI